MLQMNTPIIAAAAAPISAESALLAVEPIYAATRAHRDAWEAAREADGDARMWAADAESEALIQLLGVAPHTSAGLAELHRHLSWFHEEERERRDFAVGPERLALTRLEDVAAILGDAGRAGHARLARILKAALPLWREGYDTATIAWLLTLDRVGVIGEAEVATALARHRDGSLPLPEVA